MANREEVFFFKQKKYLFNFNFVLHENQKRTWTEIIFYLSHQAEVAFNREVDGKVCKVLKYLNVVVFFTDFYKIVLHLYPALLSQYFVNRAFNPKLAGSLLGYASK